jgi:hypothetical protein
MEIGVEVAHPGFEHTLAVDPVFELLALLQKGLGLLLILPEIRVADSYFKRGELLSG